MSNSPDLEKTEVYDDLNKHAEEWTKSPAGMLVISKQRLMSNSAAVKASKKKLIDKGHKRIDVTVSPKSFEKITRLAEAVGSQRAAVEYAVNQVKVPERK